MNDKKNEYFLKVCETGNITTAADELYVSRSVLSRALHELEEEFGAELFTRSKQGVELTESGIIVRDMMQSVTANYKYAMSRLDEVKRQKVTDNIRIGITPTNGLASFRRYLREFMREHPNIRLYIEEHSAFDICALVMDCSLDVGISPSIYGSSYLDTLVLYEDTLMIGMRKNDPLTKKKEINLSDLADLPLGFLSAKTPMEGIIKEYIDAQHKSVNTVVRTSDKSLLHEMTREGIVYPFLTKEILSGWKDVTYRSVSFVTPSVIRLLWPKAMVQRPALKEFLDFMKLKAPEFAPGGRQVLRTMQ